MSTFTHSDLANVACASNARCVRSSSKSFSASHLTQLLALDLPCVHIQCGSHFTHEYLIMT